MTQMTRREDWPERLHDFIARRACTPFAWGVQDCCRFAADAVLEMTGTDPMADLRDYASRESADALLARLGGLAAAVRGVLGKPIPPALAQRGDVVLVEVGDAKAMGICLGDVIAAPGPSGLQYAPLDDARVAWRIG